MCGIAGLIDIHGRKGPQWLRSTAAAMNDALVHRGPDDHGIWLDPSGRCALAQRRLSIVDLSPMGHQPMVDPSGNIGLTYNGETYNFREIRSRLASQGYTFKSQCDAEVVLHLLANQQVDRLPHLRGMFALALWNTHHQRLLLARDAFGKKPLYIAQSDDFIAFASELRAIEAITDFQREIDSDAVAQYLWLQYVHAPKTIYKNVTKLEPGSYAFVNLDGRITTGRFFDFQAPSPAPDVELASTYEQRLDQLDDLVTRAVQRRLMSDVPLGAFLSGGIDSALVVSRMRRLGATTRTYSVGFADSPDSEHVQARAIADHLGCSHHEIVVEPDAIELAPMIADALDEPNGDSSCLPTYLLSEFTRKHVTVALSGDGGDEMFGGYGRYFDTLADHEATDRNGFKRISDAYLGPRFTIFQLDEIEQFFGGLPPALDALNRRWCSVLDNDHQPLIHRMRTVDANGYLPGAVLAKVDRMSMQHSLEVRCPLLDTDVAAFAQALAADDCLMPAPDKPGRYAGKRILKDLLVRELPEQWVHLRKKGFGLPANFWDGPALKSFAQDLLNTPSTRLRDHLDREALDQWLTHQEQPQCFSIYRLWPMLMLELWLRKDRPASVGDRSPSAATVKCQSFQPAPVGSAP